MLTYMDSFENKRDYTQNRHDKKADLKGFYTTF